ncbi:MAG TPA: Hpt domain-containing protein [Methyloceanibacter sp.]|jgi:HPt (histidine-containing phosphotransfer) domain-containing protein|nr:Hpt domain-containing protein [Methyloceanibacter sp.]
MTMREQLRALIERNHTRLLDQLATVTRLLAAREQGGTLEPGPIVRAQNITHQLKGAAGTIGFGAISAAAAALDESLTMLLAHGRSIAADQLERPLALLAVLQQVAKETTPENSILYDADVPVLVR